jgi:hypothetical protein
MSKIGKEHCTRNKIIKDFIKSRNELDGVGYFKGDKKAVQFAASVGNNQKMKFQKYGIVPKALVEMMAEYWCLQGKDSPIHHDVAYGRFLTLLLYGPYRNESGKQICEKLYHDLICTDMPWLERSFAKGDFLYERH